MSHKSLYGKQVNPILIKGSAKSVTERMTGNPAFPSQSVLMCMDTALEKDSPWACHIQTSTESAGRELLWKGWHTGQNGFWCGGCKASYFCGRHPYNEAGIPHRCEVLRNT